MQNNLLNATIFYYLFLLAHFPRRIFSSFFFCFLVIEFILILFSSIVFIRFHFHVKKNSIFFSLQLLNNNSIFCFSFFLKLFVFIAKEITTNNSNYVGQTTLSELRFTDADDEADEDWTVEDAETQ